MDYVCRTAAWTLCACVVGHLAHGSCADASQNLPINITEATATEVVDSNAEYRGWQAVDIHTTNLRITRAHAQAPIKRNLTFTRVEPGGEGGRSSEVYRANSLDGNVEYYRPLGTGLNSIGRWAMANAEVATAMGAPHLFTPSRIVRVERNGQKELGVLSKVAEGEPATKALADGTFVPTNENLDAAKVFTFLTRQRDAHRNNFYIDDAGRFQFIDPSHTFGLTNPARISASLEIPGAAKSFYENLGSDLPPVISSELYHRLALLEQRLKTSPLEYLSPEENREFRDRLETVLVRFHKKQSASPKGAGVHFADLARRPLEIVADKYRRQGRRGLRDQQQIISQFKAIFAAQAQPPPGYQADFIPPPAGKVSVEWINYLIDAGGSSPLRFARPNIEGQVYLDALVPLVQSAWDTHR